MLHLLHLCGKIIHLSMHIRAVDIQERLPPNFEVWGKISLTQFMKKNGRDFSLSCIYNFQKSSKQTMKYLTFSSQESTNL